MQQKTYHLLALQRLPKYSTPIAMEISTTNLGNYRLRTIRETCWSTCWRRSYCGDVWRCFCTFTRTPGRRNGCTQEITAWPSSQWHTHERRCEHWCKVRSHGPSYSHLSMQRGLCLSVWLGWDRFSSLPRRAGRGAVDIQCRSPAENNGSAGWI